MSRPDKLKTLAEAEGYETALELLEECVYDSVCPGICTNDGCDYVTNVEPDSDSGWCELCDTNTVCSALMLADII